MGRHRLRQRLAQGGMRQAEIIVHVIQGHLLPQPVFALAQRADPVWSKNSCSLTLVVFQEASEPFTTRNGALTLAALAG